MLEHHETSTSASAKTGQIKTNCQCTSSFQDSLNMSQQPAVSRHAVFLSRYELTPEPGTLAPLVFYQEMKGHAIMVPRKMVSDPKIT